MTYGEIIQSYYDKTGTLSHSALEAFIENPRRFMAYKMRTIEPTESMIFGDAVHTLVLEPDMFEEKFSVLPEDTPRRPSLKQINATNPSPATLHSIEFWNEVEGNGKRAIKADAFALAEKMRDALYENESSRYVLDRITQTETALEWDAFGYKWRGRDDGRGEGIICDLKTVANAHPRKVERELMYDDNPFSHTGKNIRQAAHYKNGAGLKGDYYLIAIDKDCDISVFKISDARIEIAWQDIEMFMKQFQKCLALNMWGASYDFWRRDGIYEL